MSDKEKVTLVLPSELMERVRELAPARGQSQFIAEAINYYLSARGRREMRERLIAGYRAYAADDAALADEWRATDDEAWLDEIPEYDIEEADDGPTHPAR